MQPLWRFVVSCLLAIAAPVQAAINMEVAAGVNGNQNTALALFGASRESGQFFGAPSYQELNVGGWGGEYRSSIVGLSQGLRLPLGASVLEGSVGVSYISETSKRLSTHFEFYERLMLRRSIGSAALAISYRHWSNAGMRYPNLGMDFLGVVVSYHW